jgi:NAD(P)-dependent dehydrogenase (short-subunit alcohol dehydrogenase family)
VGLFDGKVAIVTGAGRGIGRSHALLLASEGAAVVVNDLGGSSSGDGADATPAQRVVDEITAKGGRAIANYDSVSSWTGAEAMVQQAVDEFGGLDVLINNAGILRDKMSFNMDEAEWDQVIDVHLKGHFATSRFAASYWRSKSKETGGPVNGKIVNTASESGLYGNAGQANYAAAKAGLVGMSKSLAQEVASRGITVNVVSPGFVDTAMTEVLSDAQKAKLAEQIPLGRIGQPEDIAGAVIYLASDAAAWVTGATLHVNGGMAML